MDEEPDGPPRRISNVAARRYARPPPPIPRIPPEPTPPVIPPRDRIVPARPERPDRESHLVQVHIGSRPPPPPVPRNTAVTPRNTRITAAEGRSPALHARNPAPPVRNLAASGQTVVREPSPTTTTTPVVHTQQPTSVREVRDIASVRPGSRHLNEYIDHPVRTQSQSTSDRPPASHPVFTQPTKKDQTVKDPNLTIDEESQLQQCQDSIICSKCGKCKCQSCTQPQDCCRPRWICNKSVECSLERTVEYCSCLCCVQCMFYHCLDQKEEDEPSARDAPCACCERPNCCRRWTCMAALSLCLPCLCLYWPLTCVLSACESCYHRCSRQGCHCRRDRPQNMKRLLIDSESSSA